ncbi:MAG: glycosyltransferase [Lentimicrobiaceae bacterium]
MPIFERFSIMTEQNHKNILFLPCWYPSQSDAMLGLFVQNHARTAVEAGYRVAVAYAAPARKSLAPRFEPSMVKKGDLCEVVVYFNSHQWLSSLWKLMAWLKAIRIAVREHGKPDLIHAHVLTRVVFMAWMFSKWYSVPYLITEHWSRYFPENLQYKGFVRKRVTQFLVSHAGMVTTVSKRLADAMHRGGLIFDPVILPNVIDTHIFNVKPHDHPLFRYINISCFDEKSKNLHLLLDAAALLWEQQKDFELVLAGDGVDRKAIEAYALSIGAAYPITFTGELSREEMAHCLQQADCLVLSSNYETFGIVVFEALACGVPVVVTEVADLKEFITDDLGLVVPVGNTQAMADAMRKMYLLKDHFKPSILRNRVMNFCSKDSVASALHQIYKQLIK